MNSNLFRYKNSIKFLFCVFLICSIIDSSIAAEKNWGIWTDKEKKYTYAFLKDNEFQFLGQQSSCDGIYKNVRNDGVITYECISNNTPVKVEGAWKSGSEICWVGKDNRKTGNLIIFVDLLECCMSFEILGKTTVLNQIWKKGSDAFGLCETRILTKTSNISAKE